MTRLVNGRRKTRGSESFGERDALRRPPFFFGPAKKKEGKEETG